MPIGDRLEIKTLCLSNSQRVVAPFDGALDWRKFSWDAAGVAAKVVTTNGHQSSAMDWTTGWRKLHATSKQYAAFQMPTTKTLAD